MTNKEFAFKYAGREYMYYGHKVVLVGYDDECSDVVIVSPPGSRTDGCFWEGLDYGDVITYKTDTDTYQYAPNRRTMARTWGRSRRPPPRLSQ